MRRARTGEWARTGRWSKICWIVVAGAATTVQPAHATGETITVAVASNFAAPMAKLAEGFEAATGARLVVVPGSTGKHYAQITHGAPFDIFFAADAERPQRLETEGWAVAGSRFTYALGRLVLWSPTVDRIDPEGRVLDTGQFRHLALANPRLAPYGRAALQTLERRGLLERLSGRLVLGENVAQAFQMIATGNAELGFVAWSQLEQPDPAEPAEPADPTRQAIGGSRWAVPSEFHDPIEQQAVLIRDSPAARAFLEFVRTDSSRELIRRYGYDPPPVGTELPAGPHAEDNPGGTQHAVR